MFGEYMGKRRIDLRPKVIKNFIDAKEEKEVCHILREYTNKFLDYQRSNISARGLNAKEFTILVSKDKSFKDYFVVKSTRKIINLKALQGGHTYYYKIYGDGNLKKVLREGVIKTKSTPGIYYTIDGLCNVRDLGGWETTDGRRIKQGLIIRGVRANDHDNIPVYTKEGYAIIKDALKIKGEIDFRHDQDFFGQTGNIFNKDNPYLITPFTTCCHILPSYNEGGPYNRVFDKRTPESFNKVFNFLLDKDNYPIYIHCNGGADRTGTICLIIEGVLGVPEESLLKDFELTSFSPVTKRWRSAINDDDTFDKSGISQDDQYNYVAPMRTLRILKEEYGPGEPLEKAIANYLKTVCHITDEQIATFRKMLLEDI